MASLSSSQLAWVIVIMMCSVAILWTGVFTLLPINGSAQTKKKMTNILTHTEALASYRAMMTMAPHGATIQFPGRDERQTDVHVAGALDGVFVRGHGPAGQFEHYDALEDFAATYALSLADALAPQAFA